MSERRAAQDPDGIPQALAYLAHYRLVCEEGGGWRARSIGEARRTFTEQGASPAHPLPAPATAEAAQEGRGDRRSQGTQSAPAEVVGAGLAPVAPAQEALVPHAPRAIHAPMFFDFGDY